MNMLITCTDKPKDVHAQTFTPQWRMPRRQPDGSSRPLNLVRMVNSCTQDAEKRSRPPEGAHTSKKGSGLSVERV